MWRREIKIFRAPHILKSANKWHCYEEIYIMKKDFLDWLLLGRNYSLYLVVLSMEETNIGLDLDGALPPPSPRDSGLIPGKSIG